MIIIRRFQLIMLAILVAALFVAFGWYGYHQAVRLADIGETAVMLGEKLLFAGIVAALTTAFLVFMILRVAASLERRLDRLIKQGENKDIVPGRDFVGMGPLGEKLTALFNLLSKLNYQKTRKISAMQSLVVFLIRNLEIPVLITDVTGTILYVSDILLDKRDVKRQDVINANVMEYVEGLALPHLITLITRQREPVEDSAGDVQFTCYPITDRTDEITYLAFLVGAKAGYYERRVEKTETRNRRLNLIRGGLEKLRAGFK